MNGDAPNIEIFEPFSAAYEWMKKILFQPFDFTKWLVLGFAAFLSGNSGNGIGFPSGRDWNFKSISHSTTQGTDSIPPWLIPIVIGAIAIGLVVMVVLIWISSRGRFIFTDNVVRNRAAIAAPWKEYRREGNSFFCFTLFLMLLGLVLVGVVVLAIWLTHRMFSGEWSIQLKTTVVIACILFGLIWLALSIFVALVTTFMVPVMYRRRCLAREAFFNVSRLVFARPGPFVLFALFGAVLLLALIVGSTIVTCLTCCIGGLPYVSSVVLLPAFVWLLAFKLLFLRQFGPEFDVWAPVEVPAPVLPPDSPTSLSPPAE